MTEPRDTLGMKMLAAWLNVRVDQIPPENTAHLNPHTMAAWDRVGRAAIEHFNETARDAMAQTSQEITNAPPQ